jgi:osmoprotectant transport system permease protein
MEALPELWLRTGEHIMLTGVSVIMAVMIGVPLGIVAAHRKSLQSPLLSAVGILQTIPSLAMLALLLALTGKIGALPAVIALTLYALLPIVRNTTIGISGLPKSYYEVAQSVGMRPLQRLYYAELPLASDVILGGIRTAAVIGVGIATLSAFIGAGGLGQFINRGLALRDTDLILLGAIPSAIVALFVDASLQSLGWGLRRRHNPRSSFMKSNLNIFRGLAISAPVLILVVGMAAYWTGTTASSSGQLRAQTIRIASKQFVEQFLLGEIVAQLIEAKTDLAVDRRFNLGGTMIAHGALVEGEIDLYVEYTGTALTAILKQPVINDPDRVYEIVKEMYRERYDAVWLSPLGFNNTFAISVRKADATTNNWTKISNLENAPSPLRAGFGPEFIERPDGLPGLLKTYNLNFSEVRDLELSIAYQALARGEVDVISANSTDGQLIAFDLATLEDDRQYFPPYYAAPVVRRETLERHPKLRDVIELLAGRIDEATIRALNFEIDGEGRTPEDVARDYLASTGLVPVSPSSQISP